MEYKLFKKRAQELANGSKAAKLKLMEFLVDVESQTHVWSDVHQNYGAVIRDVGVCTKREYWAYKIGRGMVNSHDRQLLGTDNLIRLGRESAEVREKVMERVKMGLLYGDGQFRKLLRELSPPAKRGASMVGRLKREVEELKRQIGEKDETIRKIEGELNGIKAVLSKMIKAA